MDFNPHVPTGDIIRRYASEAVPDMKCTLVQLESQSTGDCSLLDSSLSQVGFYSCHQASSR